MSIPKWNDSLETDDYTEFLNWIQNPEFVIKFCKAGNERYIAVHGTPWLNYSASTTGGTLHPYVTGSQGYNADSSGIYRFPEKAEALAPPKVDFPNEGYSFWNGALITQEDGSQPLIQVTESPVSLIHRICATVYKDLIFFYSDEWPDVLKSINIPTYTTNDPVKINDDIDDSIGTPHIDASLKSVAWKYNTIIPGTFTVSTWNLPIRAGGGPIAKFPREINRLDALGSEGWVARIVAASLSYAGGDATYDPAIIPFSGRRVAQYTGGVWVVQPANSTLQPDILTEKRPPRYGDYVGPWVLEDLKNTMNLLRVAMWSIEAVNLGIRTLDDPITKHGQVFPPIENMFSIFNFKQIGFKDSEEKSSFQEDTEAHSYRVYSRFFLGGPPPTGVPPTIDSTVIHNWNNQTDYDAVIVDYGDPYTIVSDTAMGDDANSHFADAELGTLNFIPYDPDAPQTVVYKNFGIESGVAAQNDVFRSKIVVAVPPVLQDLGISKQVRVFVNAARREISPIRLFSFFSYPVDDPPVNLDLVKYDWDDQGSGITMWDGENQPFLYLANELEGPDAVLVGDYIGPMSPPLHYPDPWMTAQDDTGDGGSLTECGLTAYVSAVLFNYAIEGGFRFSHLTDDD